MTMNHRTFAIATVAVTLAALPAAARNPAPIDSTAAGSSGHFSVVTGETVATGRDMVSAELGFPGFTFGYAHGINDRFDAGVKLDLLYGFRDTTLQTQFGFGMRAPLRYMAYRHGQIGVQLHAEPGLDFYTAQTGQSGDFAINVPVGVIVGFQATRELRVAGGVDLPISLAYHGPASPYLQIGPLFGGAVEYFFERQWAVGLNLRFGPQFYTVSGQNAQLGFITEVTVGYRL
jgi:hypothetical protein